MGRILQKINKNYELAGKAANGLEGLRLIEKILPDLVIMDIQMPDMDGLTMLSRLREKKIGCRVIVLSAYSDFNYARQAIELGIENYLLKPIKIPELRKALEQAEEAVERDNHREQSIALERILREALSGHLESAGALEKAALEKYGLDIKGSIGLFMVYLGACFEEKKAEAGKLLRQIQEHHHPFRSYLLEFDASRMLLMVLYDMKGEIRPYFEKSVVPMLCTNLEHKGLYAWGECQGLQVSRGVYLQMKKDLAWSIPLGEKLLDHGQLDKLEPLPLSYPMETEELMKAAIRHQDEEEFKECFRQFGRVCRSSLYAPQDIKEAALRLGWTLLNAVKEHSQGQEVLTQKVMEQIMAAVSWEEIYAVFACLFSRLVPREGQAVSREVSSLVRRARAMLYEYYTQGITLEEIAQKMGVSEEYLSAQFKKETGMSFRETIRQLRIEKIKRLLLDSNLKLNQIAALSGYADPKYMSKVFKEEVGMLPAEYRKRNK